MSGFEFGEELICLKTVGIGRDEYQSGDDFPYEDMDIELSLVESLLQKRSLVRKCRVSPKMLKELKREKVAKVIRNSPGKREVVSWPSSEPIPEGCIDCRRSAKPAVVPPQEAQGTPTTDDRDVVEIVPAGRGWYNVTVSGSVVSNNKLRKAAAEKLKEEYK